MSSACWDWMAILTGLRPVGEAFVPLYWAPVARLLAPLGYVPTPGIVLAAWIAVSLALIGVFIRARRWIWVDAACVLWGVLLADTPYVAFFPALVWLVWTLLTLFAPRALWKSGYAACTRAPRARICFVCVAAAAAAAVAHFIRYNADYPVLYLRQAVAACHWEGLWHLLEEARMDRLLDVYVTELAREGEGRSWIFTDGLCDSGIELAAGGRLRALALTGGARDAAAGRRLGLSGAEDLAALEGGVSRLLRAWTVDRPENLTNAVFQCAFAFLEREAPAGKVAPCGLVMRAADVPEAERERAWAAVCALGRAILDFHARGGQCAAGGPLRRARFCVMQWRVARALRQRARLLDRARRTDEALAMTSFSEKLDALNPLARRLGTDAGTTDLHVFGAITPREGLAFALSRANFALARQFAQPILKDEPAHAEANFAMAMSHLAAKEYAQARRYFERALAARPQDAALLNNLAVAELKLDDLDAAEKHARAALAIKSDAAAIQDTLRQIALRRGRPAAAESK